MADETVTEAAVMPAVLTALICSSRQLVCHLYFFCAGPNLLFCKHPLPDSVCTVYVCVAFDSWFVFDCHCSPVLLVTSSSSPPFLFTLHLSFLSFRKGSWELRLTSTHSLPEPFKSLASCPRSLQITFSSSRSPVLFLPLCPGECVE